MSIGLPVPLAFFEQKVTFMDATPFYTDLTGAGLLEKAANGTLYRYVPFQIPNVYTDDVLYARKEDLEQFKQFVFASGQDKWAFLTDHAAQCWDLVPGAIRGMLGAETVDEAADAFAAWSAQDVFARRAAHELFYRVPSLPSEIHLPPGSRTDITLDFARRMAVNTAGRYMFGPLAAGAMFDHTQVPADAYAPQLETAAARLGPSRTMRALAYAADPASGLPVVVAASGEGVNFSDPLAYEVDYGLMCLLSLYQAEMAWSAENDPEIQATTFLIAALQTVVSVMAGRVALASRPAALLSFTEASAAATAGQSLFSGIVGEIGTELVVEQIGSTLATWAGASPFWAEFVIGEKFGDAMSASKILVSLKTMVYSAVMASQAVVQAAASRIARPSPGVIETKAIRALGTAGRNALGALLEATVETATAARAAGVATPGMAPSMLSALVGSMEQVIADRAANCRGLETAGATFLDAFAGATFADYPGTLLDGHQMAVVMLAAALLHPGAPIVGLLNLPSIRALFGVQPGSGRGHYLQVAVKGVGVYTFRDTGECTLKRADGTVQALDQSPALLEIALTPNAGPLQFVDPPTKLNLESNNYVYKNLNHNDYLGIALDKNIIPKYLLGDFNAIQSLIKQNPNILQQVYLENGKGMIIEKQNNEYMISTLLQSDPKIGCGHYSLISIMNFIAQIEQKANRYQIISTFLNILLRTARTVDDQSFLNDFGDFETFVNQLLMHPQDMVDNFISQYSPSLLQTHDIEILELLTRIKAQLSDQSYLDWDYLQPSKIQKLDLIKILYEYSNRGPIMYGREGHVITIFNAEITNGQIYFFYMDPILNRIVRVHETYFLQTFYEAQYPSRPPPYFICFFVKEYM